MGHAVLRRAFRHETPEIALVFLAARRGLLPDVPMVHPDDDVEPWIREELFYETEIWVAVANGRIVAMMSLAPGWVEHLYVHPEAQRTGVGTELLDLAKNSPLAGGGLALWTFQANSGARRFYERHGFVAVELTDGDGNEERTPDVRYEWR
jgi:GNAT superfamily N-acetyltransferase